MDSRPLLNGYKQRLQKTEYTEGGQVFTETVIIGTREPGMNYTVRPMSRPERGAPSLHDIALHLMLQTARGLAPEHIQCLGFPLQQALWVKAREQ